MSDLHQHIIETIGVPLDKARHASPDVHEFGDALLAPSDADVSSLTAGGASSFAGYSPAVARADHVHALNTAQLTDPAIGRGIVTKPYYKITANSPTVAGTELVISGSDIHWIADPARLYKVCLSGNAVSGAAGDVGIIRVRKDSSSGPSLIQHNCFCQVAAIGTPVAAHNLISGLSGSQAVVMTTQRYSGTTGFGLSANANYPFFMWVEDLGLA